MSSEASREATEDVWAVMADQRIAMLTVEEEGKLVSRPMASIARPEENRIYFVTRIESGVGEAGRPVPVNLGYADTHKNTYLSVSGTASTSQDRAKLRELWSMWVEAWLPQGPDGEDVALITVEPDDAKLWDSTSSNLIYAGKVLKAVVTQRPPDGGRVEQVDLNASGGDGACAPDTVRPAMPDSATAGAYDDAMRKVSEGLDAPSAGGPAI